MHNFLHILLMKNTEKVCFLLFFQTVLHTGTSMGQSFIIGCWYFLKNCKLPVWTKTIICCQYFSCYLFVSLWYFCHVFALPIKWWFMDDFSVFHCVGPWGCCCVLNPESTMWVTHFLAWWGIAISPITCISISAIIFGWMARSLDQRVH